MRPVPVHLPNAIYNVGVIREKTTDRESSLFVVLSSLAVREQRAPSAHCKKVGNTPPCVEATE